MAPATGIAAPAARSVAHIRDLGDAILHTLVYADLFDYPLKVEEIHRYLTGYSASLEAVERHLQQNTRLAERLAATAPFCALAGREHLLGLRRERETFSVELWRQARRYGRLIAALPFVRLVSVTGSLAMNNATGPQDDVDFLIVATRGRVWLARGLVILVVHLAERFGVELCPNYLVAEGCLQLGEPNLFAAHELAQLVPLHGLETYWRLLESNAWVRAFLPNATPRPAGVSDIGPGARAGQSLLEGVLGGSVGAALERWEQGRKIPRLQKLADEKGGAGAIYTPELCKGHADDHGPNVYERYVAHLAAQGIEL